MGEGGAETLTASLQDVRIFLMLSDMVGIYSGRAELKRLAGAPSYGFAALQGTLGTREASKNIISFI